MRVGVELDIPRSLLKKCNTEFLHPSAVLLDPEGCTSSRLPARLGDKNSDSEDNLVVMSTCKCKLNYRRSRLRFLSGLFRPTSLLYDKQFVMFCAQGFFLWLSATVPSGTIVECSRVYVGSWDPWDPGTVVLEIPKGFLRRQQESALPEPENQISMIF